MSDGVKFVFKTLFKVPCIIIAAYFLLNVFGLVTTYFKVQGVQYGLENIVVENNYISRSDLEHIMPQLWALGYAKDDKTGNWHKTAYVEHIGLIVQNESGVETFVEIPAPNSGGTNGAMAASSIINQVNATAGFTDSNNSPLSRSQYGRAKVVGCYANYAVLWPLTVYNDPTGGAFGNSTAEAVSGYDSGNWQNTASGAPGAQMSIFTGNANVDTADNGKDHSRVIEVPIRMRNTVVGIKYYADLHN